MMKKKEEKKEKQKNKNILYISYLEIRKEDNIP